MRPETPLLLWLRLWGRAGQLFRQLNETESAQSGQKARLVQR